MQQFHKHLEEIIERINFLEARRVKFGKFVRKINGEFKIGPNEEISDVQIINKLSDSFPEKVSVVGVDGGIVKKSYHGLDLILMRAAGVNFVYEKNKLKHVNYYPSSNPIPEPKMLTDPFSDNELSSCYNFERQIMEVQTTIDAVNKMKPDVVFLDGSVIPHYINKPDNQKLKDYYQEMIGKYKELFKITKDQGVILSGIIEDSRGVKFCDILNRRLMSKMGSELSSELQKILEKTKDSNLLVYILRKGERTCIFNYSMNSEMHPVLKEFEKMKKSFLSFYIKTVEFDRPVRVDFVGNGNAIETANKISSILMKTSGHAGYGLPAVLIEADQRAKLSERDVDMFYSDLVGRVGNVSSLFKMRREMRPF
ncbi:MAG: hypothetical protein COY38_01470 [Candidatus Aenigmarchaeota archaeon CG_4_10_14_0_8_um_filter_37_24]|nr:DNA double-strand break repair nuclease NurA [Candidatus Aenigmarchaeota archaeon]OIN88546.1 MAG: hypothetical protein AUJ50_00735 [Candidatus Aenigmarchaeota archaeon CG1_02_38_14]PIV68889.1 MAG: hypothetical protein COS07_02820 [Candidatus Aenigmarchaeota archaeon CG01_land_8_20_14_3_00_37_9]PIW41064.1 MAG: hypothetical protein COW21_03695 [Candidatus Aenigmarchaeota archaeon CG15_BIG_FIL_POST_REV_8_21_14_020_37_27]PIX50913.1 MAG: hypothetical protein COZ52_01495 [Candidatus Aenigmarchaeot